MTDVIEAGQLLDFFLQIKYYDLTDPVMILDSTNVLITGCKLWNKILQTC